ncbi:hypothetical protein QWY20_05875 [Alkalimonas sp. MEB108]|uniref:Uncharacterized protein n=1 Tax=Alkalimonas cellulosilytica TaxID=3058395 RepID=A0ABU7J3V8_9GAMM|nr:hypothetical protein [Alkalimonas sp. MEB108]MEE2000975.1 hypothetical protein [Alkalimonas sp. MEB108]
MSDLIDVILKACAAAFKYIVIYGFIDFLVHGCGYLILKLLSFGRFPASRQHNRQACIATGFVVFVGVVAVIAVSNG